MTSAGDRGTNSVRLTAVSLLLRHSLGNDWVSLLIVSEARSRSM